MRNSVQITISGELGSGKSTVARLLGDRLSRRVVGSGDVQRAIAAEMGLSTLQVNWLAEESETIDKDIDAALAKLGESEQSLIIDARMGWHFIPDAFKVHLLVAPDVGAERLMAGRYSSVEAYGSRDDARVAADQRFASERRRFLSKYGVDIARLRNYDLVVDTSDARPEQIADAIIEAFEKRDSTDSLMRISPRRVVPTGDAVRELSERAISANKSASTYTFPVVGYSRPFFFLLRGEAALSGALDEQLALVPAFLEVESDEQVVGGMNAEQYFQSETRRSGVYDWEDAHGFKFADYPSFLSS